MTGNEPRPQSTALREAHPPFNPGPPPHRHSGPAFGAGEAFREIVPGEQMLTLADEEELLQRASRRAPRRSTGA
ncbi:hypothetical protein [Nonomuraea sp. SBT364]|uniref:hypothetical protein n=1 Tax=Nonomuraea sp. SBT364 TaxID=1580530 RepID=UPI000A6C06AC|nr:hypothetical protein [Nonomuraea sp. SBT364]